MAATHTFSIYLAPRQHPFDIADFRGILADLRALPFVSNVWVDDEVDWMISLAESGGVFRLEVDITAAKDEQQTCYHEIVETIGRHASYELIGV